MSTSESVQASGDLAVKSLVSILSTIQLEGPSRSVLQSGHYAAVLKFTDELGVAITTDGVGTKLILAQEAQTLDGVGVDCVAMNVNDIICVGARPIALVDYLAVQQADPEALIAIAHGLKTGSELAGVEVPGGELAVVPELIRGHPSPHGFDLAATCIGSVELSKIITGSDCRPGDAIIGVPSSGLHSNGYTMVRQALRDHSVCLSDRPSELQGATVAQALLAPTVIYVKAICSLLDTDTPINGLAHITGGGIANVLRLNPSIGLGIDEPLGQPAVYDFLRQLELPEKRLWQELNMGCGFCVIVKPELVDDVISQLNPHHPGSRQIGSLTDQPAVVEVKGVTL